MVFWRTWLLAFGDEIEVQKAPPVPTTNCRMPRALSSCPLGFWGAKRS